MRNVVRMVVIGVTLFAAVAGLPEAEEQDKKRPIQWNWSTLAGITGAMTASALSMAAGVGGGGILVPIFNVILGFGIKQSTGLSQAVIASSGIGSAVYSLTRSHPNAPEKPLIDIPLALTLIPALLLGINFGVLGNSVLPTSVITLVVLVVLTYVARRTLAMGVRLRRAEQLAERQSVYPLLDEDGSDEEGAEPRDLGAPIAVTESREATIPWWGICQFMILWMMFAGFNVTLGQFDRCTWKFAAFYFLQFVLAVGATVWFVRSALPRAPAGPAEGLDTDAENALNAWADGALHGMVPWVVVAGSIAGLIGMGGGFLINPLMIENGIHPQVSSATSSFLVLFSAASATLQFLVAGRLNVSYAVLFGVACGVATFTGVTIVGKAISRIGASFLVLLLSGVMAVGVLATAAFEGRREIVAALNGTSPGFQPFCHNASTLDVGRLYYVPF